MAGPARQDGHSRWSPRGRALWAGLAVTLGVGCMTIAGLDDDYRLGEPQTTSPTGAGQTTGSGTSTSSGGNTSTGGTGASTSTGGSGGSTTTGGSGGQGGFGGFGGYGGFGGFPPVPELPCGNETCSGGDLCCVSPPPNQYNGCHPPGGCPNGNDIEIDCDGPEDCPSGELCCGTYNGGYYEVDCATTCNGAEEYIMCGGPGAPNHGLCANQCNASNALPGYYYCG